MANSPEKPVGTIRLRHIAQVTGLSIGTISKVLNGREGVSEENREKVQRAVADLGFRRWPTMGPTESPLSSATVITYGVGAYGGTFYDQVLRAIIATGQKHGVAIDVSLLMVPSTSAEIPESYLFQNGVPEAVILLGVDHLPVLDKIAATGCPVVLANGIDPMMRFDSVSPDYFLGGYLATHHLLDLGHRDIVHVGTARRMTLDLRRQGFVAALAKAGIAYDPKRHFIDIGVQDFATLDEDVLASQIDKNGKLKSTAFFAVADDVAIGIMQRLNAYGFSVPHDASVMGYDDLAVSAHCIPALTTLRAELNVLGQTAVEMLVDRATNPQKHVSRVSIGSGLVVRESTAPIRTAS